MYPFRNSYLNSSSSTLAMFAKSLFCAAVLILTASPLYAIEQDRITSLRNSVFALNSARQTALHELENASLSSREVTDYRDFIVYLNTRITNYCMELAEQGGSTALEGLSCPTSLMTTNANEKHIYTTENIFYTTGTASEPQTQAEKTAELDGDLLAALGEFDEMLLKEEAKVATRVPSQRESASTSQSGASGSAGSSGDTGETGSGEVGEAGEKGEGTEGDSVAGGQESQTGDATGTQGSVGAGNTGVDHSAYGAPGGKLPPPEDDDIVARQLREAAEKEPDPELKNKLWEEYWKYKGVRK